MNIKTPSPQHKFVKSYGHPKAIKNSDDASQEMALMRKLILKDNISDMHVLEFCVLRTRLFRSLFTSLRNETNDMLQFLVSHRAGDSRIPFSNAIEGNRFTPEWWERRALRKFEILNPKLISLRTCSKKKIRKQSDHQAKRPNLRNDVPIYIVTGITGKKRPIEEACGFEVNEVLTERWAPNLKKIHALCEATQKTPFGIIAFLCKNTCHAVSEVALKMTKGASKWIVLKIFKNNTTEIADKIKSALVTAGIQI